MEKKTDERTRKVEIRTRKKFMAVGKTCGYILTFRLYRKSICQLWVLNRGDLISASTGPYCRTNSGSAVERTVSLDDNVALHYNDYKNNVFVSKGWLESTV